MTRTVTGGPCQWPRLGERRPALSAADRGRRAGRSSTVRSDRELENTKNDRPHSLPEWSPKSDFKLLRLLGRSRVLSGAPFSQKKENSGTVEMDKNNMVVVNAIMRESIKKEEKAIRLREFFSLNPKVYTV